jgi:hypothetical protein
MAGPDDHQPLAEASKCRIGLYCANATRRFRAYLTLLGVRCASFSAPLGFRHLGKQGASKRLKRETGRNG